MKLSLARLLPLTVLGTLVIVACSGANPQQVQGDIPPPAPKPTPNVDASVPDVGSDSDQPDVFQPPSCVPEDNASFCGRNGKQCGQFSATDNCGELRSVQVCGVCGNKEICSINTCKDAPVDCVPDTNVVLCSKLGKQCGSVSVLFDNCGKPRTIPDCGVCILPATCSPENVCAAPVCVPEADATFCARTGKNCGVLAAPGLTDNCGSLRVPNCDVAGPTACSDGWLGKGWSCTNNVCIPAPVSFTCTASQAGITYNYHLVVTALGAGTATADINNMNGQLGQGSAVFPVGAPNGAFAPVQVLPPNPVAGNGAFLFEINKGTNQVNMHAAPSVGGAFVVFGPTLPCVVN